jgi:hypothetical protein
MGDIPFKRKRLANELERAIRAAIVTGLGSNGFFEKPSAGVNA